MAIPRQARTWLQGGPAPATAGLEVGIATVPHPRARLTAGSRRPLIADLHRVSFIGAAGLRVLATAARQAAAPTASACTSRRPAPVPRLLGLTGLDRHILLVRTLADARAEPPPGWDVPANGHWWRAGSHRRP